MAQHLEFTLPGDPPVLVTVEEDGGDLVFHIDVGVGASIADLRGIFFDVADPSLLSGLSATGSVVTSTQFADGAVSDLGTGANTNGPGPGAYDAGIEIGTAGIGGDDIQSATFRLSHATEDLDLSFLADQNFAARLMSAGDNDGDRDDDEGSLKLLGESGEPVCFYPGTRIATPTGEVPVESLKPGDLVLTADGRVLPVRWLGRQTVATRFADPQRALPIRIAAGALAEAVPSRDLMVSPSHALLVGGVLIQAGALVNGATICRVADVPRVFTYWHVELPEHALLLAEGAPAESFVDNVDREHFDNWDEHDAAGSEVEEMPLPRAKSHRQVPMALRQAIADRAAALQAGAAKAA